ncbi:MAG: NosD domain-containing protein [Armatimonadota bacterium]
MRMTMVMLMACACSIAAMAACLAAEYHVAQRHPRAADDNPGTAQRPWETISHAANALQPGDTVIVHEGIYPEAVTIGVSGAPERPIVLEGERGPEGQWRTIVDRSAAVREWVPAPEIGSRVYKATQLDFAPYSMTLDGKLLARIRDDYMRGTEGAEYLTLPPTAPNKDGAGDAISFWDGVEALYGHREGVTYIRFRNGDDPNGMHLKAAPAGGGFTLTNKSHVVIRGFAVRGAQDSVVIEGEASRHNVIEGNHLLNGHNRAVIRDGASHNIVRDSEMTPNYFGYASPGAWGTAQPSKHTVIREHIYRVFKYLVGPNSSDDRGVLLRSAGEGNEVSGNHIHAGLIGVSCGRAPKLRVHHNVIHNMSSIGILTSENRGKGVHDGEFYENLVYDCNINLRIHHYNTPRDNQRREFHYRNLFYQPEGLGSHIFVHWLNDQWPPETEHPEIWIYHNTFAGGRRAIQPSGWATKGGGLRSTHFVNNILSSAMFCYASTAFIGGRDMIGLFDYNWVGGVYHHGVPAWFGSHNVKAEGQQLWPHGEMPDFRLVARSPARGKGIDLSKPFVLEGSTYQPLPGIKPGYFSGLAPDVGALQYSRTAPVDLPAARLGD